MSDKSKTIRISQKCHKELKKISVEYDLNLSDLANRILEYILFENRDILEDIMKQISVMKQNSNE